MIECLPSVCENQFLISKEVVMKTTKNVCTKISTMNTVHRLLFVGFLLMALILTGCATGVGLTVQQPDNTADIPTIQVDESDQLQGTQVPEGTAADSNLATNSPEVVALSFFQAYMKANQAMESTLGNPEFDAQKYLSDDYLKQVAEIQAGFEGPGFDPILQAQAIPPEPIEVKEAQVDDGQATVILQFGRTVLEQPWERTISLEKIAGEWKIVPDRLTSGSLDSEATVQAFYDWYLAYIGTGEQFRNPLTDYAYRTAPHLTMDMVQKVDRMAEDGFGFDPFLCAQDVPTEIKLVASFYNGARPTVVMGSNFPGHFIIADLARTNFNTWLIRDITCGTNPTGYVKAFYTWALDYAVGSGEMHNPLLEGAYQDSGFLNHSLITELDSLVSSGESLMADPIFLAQDFPTIFNTEPCSEENCALVNMQYNDALIRQLRVDLVRDNGVLRIAGVSIPARLDSPQPAQEVTGVDFWVPFVDEVFGFAVSFPAGWQVKTSPVTDLHSPEEYPVMRTSSFVAPIEGSQAVPFRVEVMVGDEEILSYTFPIDEKVADTELNGYPAAVYRSEPGLISYVFRHPAKENVWVVFIDPVTQFPGREELAEAVDGVFEAMLSTVSFSE
jgi:hypothetical protein